MSLIGSIEPFKPKEVEVTSYLERMEQLFLCNCVEDNKKVCMFLTLIGGEAYAVFKDLLSPELPSTKSYQELKECLLKYYKPKRLVIAERYQFYNCKQEESENILAYTIKLKALVKYCEFGQFLDEALRDKFVCGLKSETTKKKLLTEETLTFAKAVQVATSVELAESQVRAIGPETVNKFNVGKGKRPESVQKSYESKSNKKLSQSSQSSSQSRVLSKCRRCLRLHLDLSKCPAVHWKCFACEQVGHTAKSPLCKNRVHHVEGESETKEQEYCQDEEGEIDEKDIVYWASISKSVEVHRSVLADDTSPMTVDVEIEGKIVQMEIDTGANSTIMPLKMFKARYPNVTLIQQNCKVNTLFGQSNSHVFKAVVNVTFAEVKKSLELKVVNYDSEVCLLGRCWLNMLIPGWKDKLLNISKSQMSINNVNSLKLSPDLTNNVTLQFIDDLKNKYKDVISQSGCIKDFIVNIKLKDNVVPKFCKPYRIPYALKDRVETEINSLVKEGILEPVTTAEWASPIVVVPKPDGKKLRICGDFRVTINQYIENQYYPLPTTEEIFASLSGGTIFSVIDLKNAYLQLKVSEDSKKVLTVNTPLDTPYLPV